MHVTGSMFSRGLILRLGNALADTPVIYLAGARQVGKSTLAASFPSSRRYVTLDNVAELSAARADPVGFIAAREADGGIPVVIDEVQRAPDLLLSIKANVDRDRRPGRFLLTGSVDQWNRKST
jgi:predicted AAA+ superfamily ATPase